MATAAEFSIGTNAAMPVALAYINAMVPEMFRNNIPLNDVQTMVAQIVVASANAIDAARNAAEITAKLKARQENAL